MLTQETITVLLIAFVINGLVVLAIIANRLLDRRRRHVAARAEAAGRPWFPSPSADSDALADRIGAPPPLPMPTLASAATWASWIDEELPRIARYQRPATGVIVEQAGLDRLSARSGMTAAERLLPPVATTVLAQARSADRVARLGPARFGILLVETDEIRAINYVERVRSGCDLWLAAGAVALRLAIGWAELRPGQPAAATMAEAEARLFGERREFEPAEPTPGLDARDGRRPTLQPSRS
jgi:GGDEF domain-containing protein